MNIENNHSVTFFKHKEGTTSSYIYDSGKQGILPNSISIIPFKGFSSNPKVKYQLNARYKKDEVGKYYYMNNQIIHTKITSITEVPEFTGYGDIDLRFNYEDLIILRRAGEFLEVHHFTGCAKPEYINPVINYFNEYTKKQKPHN